MIQNNPETTLYDVVIIGSGLAGLASAVRLGEESRKLRVGVLSAGSGASASISGLNAVATPKPYGDSNQQYIRDMLQIGEHLGSIGMVEQMCCVVSRCVEWLEHRGVEFARRDGKLLQRHASGCTFPRTLYHSGGLLGPHMMQKLRSRLLDSGVDLIDQTVCTSLLTDGGSVRGIVATGPSDANRMLLAPVVVAAWGGVGRLFPESTYPKDVDGRTLAMAFDCGARLIDLEFVEYEPTVIIWPPEASGELLPTALFGDGAHLLNRDYERFILGVRSQGETGCPKTVMNRAIWQEISDGRGSEHGGVYGDLRHVPRSTVAAYPWFYERIVNSGLDPSKDLLELRPMAHGHLGGMEVDPGYQSLVDGLYAVGEAVGGIHGACRLAGNATTQALVSGILGAESILGRTIVSKSPSVPKLPHIKRNAEAAQSLLPEVKSILEKISGPTRDADTLETCIEELSTLLNSPKTSEDEPARQSALSALLIAQSSLLRTESRGHHYRTDYPLLDQSWQASIELYRGADGAVQWKRIDSAAGRP